MPHASSLAGKTKFNTVFQPCFPILPGGFFFNILITEQDELQIAFELFFDVNKLVGLFVKDDHNRAKMFELKDSYLDNAPAIDCRASL